tara:strand:- start:230 stop:418 length:189 start_codon:yes stop_codon:yes gene_type:complete
MKTLTERNIDTKKIDYVDIDKTINSLTLFYKNDSYMLCKLNSFSKQQINILKKYQKGESNAL